MVDSQYTDADHTVLKQYVAGEWFIPSGSASSNNPPPWLPPTYCFALLR